MGAFDTEYAELIDTFDIENAELIDTLKQYMPNSLIHLILKMQN